jgi:hypothetical protein
MFDGYGSFHLVAGVQVIDADQDAVVSYSDGSSESTTGINIKVAGSSGTSGSPSSSFSKYCGSGWVESCSGEYMLSYSGDHSKAFAGSSVRGVTPTHFTLSSV